MRAIDYAFRQAWNSLSRSRAASAFAVMAITLATTVLGALLLLTSNAERVLGQWTAAAEFSVYLADDATSEQRGTIEDAITASGVATDHEYVSKAGAIARFRQDFAELASLTAGLEDNPFPASVEVRVRPEAQEDGRAEALVKRIAGLPGVADVRYDREWLERLSSGLNGTRTAGLALALLMAAAAAATVAAVVRLGLHARRDELEIMELVGSPLAYIRGPFIAEGLLQGGTGALLAIAVLWIGASVGGAWWGGRVDAVLPGADLHFLPVRLCALLTLGGMAVGGLGGLAASRHAG